MAINIDGIDFKDFLWTKKNTDGSITGVRLSIQNLPTNIVTTADISGKENISNKVTAISSSSTTTQYASAKAIYDILPKVIR